MSAVITPSAERSTRLRRVALVSPGWPPGTLANGILTYVANLRAGLQAEGVGSCVIANGVSPGAEADLARGDAIDAAAIMPPWSARLAWKVRQNALGTDTLAERIADRITQAVSRAHARRPIDLVEMEETFGAARFVQGTLPAPLVVRLHGPWCVVGPALGLPEDKELVVRVQAEGEGIRRADAVSSPSRFALDCVRRHYGVGLPEAAVIPNPIAPVPLDQRWRRAACDGKTILFVGRFDRLKGGDVVLQAFRRVAAELPTAELVFVGPDRGLRDDAGKTWPFADYVRAHLPRELEPRVRTLGEQPASVIAGLRRQAAATLVASRFETFSMTTVEAMAAGSPVVAPAAAAMAEIVRDGENGLAFKAGDAEDAARVLLTLFRDPALAEKVGAAGAEDAARRYAPEVIARQMISFYEQVCARRH
jgi:glycosyltransferase involved in cell wall biosynthesis